jgi:hypothetical protein
MGCGVLDRRLEFPGAEVDSCLEGRLLYADFPTFVMASALGYCSNSSRSGLGAPSRSPARIGRPRRRPIDSFPTRGLARTRFRLGTFYVPESGSRPLAVIYLLDQLVSDTAKTAALGNGISLYLTKLARLGGYLARAKDPPPGNTVMWRGLTRLTDIQLGFILGAQLVGN